MKYSIRKGCWESNSSSVHTITISKAGLEKNRMRLYDGMIHIHCRAYDKEPEILESQKEKLTYIVSWVVYKHGGYGWKTMLEKYLEEVRTRTGSRKLELRGIIYTIL